MRRHRLGALFLTVSLACGLAEGTQVRLLSLSEMTQRAARIFAGRCLHSEVVFDVVVGSPVTVATFEVDRGIKGVEGGTVTVRMLSRPDAVDPFRPGEEVVLFLYGDSPLGLTAPVGLGQGRFVIGSDKQGRRRIHNELGNRNLRHRGRLHSLSSAELDPEALLDMVEQLVAGR
jgi:hypothetical protein